MRIGHWHIYEAILELHPHLRDNRALELHAQVAHFVPTQLPTEFDIRTWS